MDESDTKILSESLNVVHPYGSLGDLYGKSGELTFGASEDWRFAFQASKLIKTFSEGMDSETHDIIAKALSNAEFAIFLGFGFISINNNFLFDKGPFEIQSVIGTVFKIPEERVFAIEDKIKQNLMMRTEKHGESWQRGTPNLVNDTCAMTINRFAHQIMDIL